MDLQRLFEAGGTYIKNPNYNESTKDTQPEFIRVADIDRTKSANNTLADLMFKSNARGDFDPISVGDEHDKYYKYGITPNKWDTTLDKQLANAQSAREKLWNSAIQTIGSELILGVGKSFSDLIDATTIGLVERVVTGKNDYSNVVSSWLEEGQEYIRNKYAPIYTDPDKDIFNGGLTDVGWYAQNFPSVISSLTLLLPSKGGVFAAGKLAKWLNLPKIVGNTRRALTGARNIKTAEEAAKLGKIGRWANKSSTVTAANRMVEVGLTAGLMRTMENYQESRQVYNDMYKEASQALLNMSDDEYNTFVNANAKELGDVDTTNRDEVAKKLASKSADKTFVMDYANIVFDVAQVYALRNPLKITKSMRETSAVRRAQRLAKQYAGKTEKEIAELEAKRSIGRKAKDWVQGHIPGTKIALAEWTEAIEEGINFIATEEGMHYGRTMYDPKNNPETSFITRMDSYLRSPGLYESAFWGFVGGVVFQEGGSVIQRQYNKLRGRIEDSKAKKKGEKTKEDINTPWRDKYELPENKGRIAEIKGRQFELERLGNRIQQIEDNIDPFNRDEKDPTKQAALTTDEQKEIAKQRAIDEYVYNMAFNAAEHGNYDLLKEYLRDENVRKVLAERGIIENSSFEQVEELIQKMDNVVEKYEDHLIALDGMSQAFPGVPFEYLQIIAKDNAAADLQIDRLDRAKSIYELSADTNFRRSKDNLDPNIDYKSAVELVVASRRLAMLRAKKKEVLENPEYSKSVNGQIQIRQIDNEIKRINDHLFSDDFGSGEGTSSFGNKLARALWANGISSKTILNPNGTLGFNNTSEDYLKFLDAIASKDTKAFSKLLGRKIEATDEELVELFGDSTNDSGTYYSLAEQLNDAFDVEKGLDRNASALNSDYQNLAAIKLAKLEQENLKATTTKTVLDRINELHNSFNEARKKAIENAESAIFDLGDKYGHTKIANHIFYGDEIKGMTSEEKAQLDDSLEILNFDSDANISLGQSLYFTLLRRETARETKIAKEEESFPTSEQEKSESVSSEVDDTSSEASESTTRQSSTEESEETPSVLATGRMSIDMNMDNQVIVDKNLGVDDKGYNYIEHPDGTIELSRDENNPLTKEDISNPNFYEGYNPRKRKPFKVESYPILKKDENGDYTVVEKGVVSYDEAPKTKPKQEPKAEIAAETKVEAEAEPDKATITSTGEVVEPSSPEKTKAKAKEEPVVHAISDEDAERLHYSVIQRANDIFKDLPKDGNLADTLNQVRDDLTEEFKDNKHKDLISNAINRAIKVLEIRAKKKQKLVESTSNVFSAITEERGRYIVNDAFKEATRQMIEDYCKEYDIKEFNGKKYINLENIFRRLNKLFEDNIADILYGSIHTYLNSQDGKQHYVVVDGSNDRTTLLKNVNTNETKRIEDIIGSSNENNIHRVSIDEFFEKPTKEFLKAFDSLSKGDKLTMTVSDGDVILQKDGVTIGRLPKPAISQTGAFYKHNKGWRTDVTKVDGEIVSNLKDFLSDVLKYEDGKHINDCIAELNFTNPTKERKEELINEIYNELVSKFDVVGKGFVAKDASKQDVVEHLANLWKYYTSVASAEPEVKEMLIDISLDKWFEKLYKEYKLIDDLAKTTSDTFDNIEVTVENINSGEINRVVNTERIDEEGNYDKFNYSNEAFADDVKDKVVVSVAKKQGEVTRTDGNVEDYIAANKAGTIYIGVPNKNGSWDYVVGTSVVFGDNKLDHNSDAGKLMSAIKTELNSIIDSKDESKLDNLDDFLQQLFNNYGRTNLFYGVLYNSKTKKLYTAYTNKELFVNNSTINNSDFKTKLYDIIDEAKFNVAYSYIDADSKNYSHSGLAYRETKDGKNKFIVEIPNYNDDANPRLRLEYDSFNQFAINSGILKVNIEVKNGSNYSRKGKNQKANQVLNVKLTSKTTSPVKETVDNSQTTSSTSNAEAILKDDNIENKADALLENVISDETLKKLNKLHILPKNIIFDESLNYSENTRELNAVAKLETGETVVGKRWLDMFNEQGEFSGARPGEYKDQAIRKLIHEQLHHKLYKRGRKEYLAKTEEIYNEFRQAVSNESDEVKANIEKYNLLSAVRAKLDKRLTNKSIIEGSSDNEIIDYIFDNEEFADLKNVILEEFLVESLTSGELVNYLNSVDANVEKTKLKNNIWQRILKVLGDIFGWNIRKGSLREKQLYGLQQDLGAIREALNNVKTATYKQLDLFENNGQQETNITSTENISESEVKKESKKESILDRIKRARQNIEQNTDIRGSIVTEKVNDYTSEMQSIKDQAIANDTFMKAPNGNSTNLNERQWLQVRTKNFLNWFGDWINNPANASKVIDENGEPLVVYHSTDAEFTKFDDTFEYIHPDDGHYFSSDIEYSKQFGKNTISAFLNIRNPRIAETTLDHDSVRRMFTVDYVESDGIIGKDTVLDINASTGTEYVVLFPRQIKSATSNDGSFSNTNGDIRYSSVTEQPTPQSSVLDFMSRLPIEEQHKFATSLHAGEINGSCM